MDKYTVASVAVTHCCRAKLEAAHKGCKCSRPLVGAGHSNDVNRFGQADDETTMTGWQTRMRARGEPLRAKADVMRNVRAATAVPASRRRSSDPRYASRRIIRGRLHDGKSGFIAWNVRF